MPSGCAAALAKLPPVPANAKQAAADTDALGGEKGGTLASLMDSVAADALNIGFDLSMGGSVSSNLTTFRSDEAAVRTYCHPS